MDTKDYTYLAIIAIVLLGGITYNVIDTGEEIVCRTNKPNGWEIVEEYDGYVKAVCPYKTKEPVTELCSSFRSTPSYLRYGCNKVSLIEKEVIQQVYGRSAPPDEICIKRGCIAQ